MDQEQEKTELEVPVESGSAPRPLSAFLYGRGLDDPASDEVLSEKSACGNIAAGENSDSLFAVTTSSSSILPEMPLSAPAGQVQPKPVYPKIRPLRRIDYPLYDTEDTPSLFDFTADTPSVPQNAPLPVREEVRPPESVPSPIPVSAPASSAVSTTPAAAEEKPVLGAPFPLDDRTDTEKFPLFRRYIELVNRRNPFLTLPAAPEPENTCQNKKDWKNKEAAQFLSALPAEAQEPFREFLRSLRVE